MVTQHKRYDVPLPIGTLVKFLGVDVVGRGFGIVLREESTKDNHGSMVHTHGPIITVYWQNLCCERREFRSRLRIVPEVIQKEYK